MSGKRIGRRFAALVLVSMLVGVLPVLAATVDLSIPIESIVRGPNGSQHLLITVDVPVENQGEECRVSAEARNQGSVHPDSDLLVASSTSVEILDVENAAYGIVYADGLITLSDTITVTLTLGADEVFSGGLDLTVDCPPLNPIIITTTTTTSTQAETTDASSGSSDSTTSTDGAWGDGEGASSDSTASTEATTGDSDVAGVSVTAAPSTDAAAAGSSETLPFTGIADGRMGGVAFALVLLGGLVVLSVRRRETEVVVAQDWQRLVDFYDIKF
jgi:hypothetical protein